MSDEDRIARVARALCVADGQDPKAGITIGTGLVGFGDVPQVKLTLAS